MLAPAPAYDLWPSCRGVEPLDKHRLVLSHCLALRGLGPPFQGGCLSPWWTVPFMENPALTG
jgi:hypothetical protein